MTDEKIRKAAENNRFVRYCGIQLRKDTDGSYYAQVELEPKHQNPYGIAHGGLLYTMADTTAGNNARRFGERPVTLDSDFHFLKNVSSGILTAKAELVRTGRRIFVIRVRVTTESGMLLAEGTFTYYNAE